MTMAQPLSGPSAWHGTDMADSPRWIRELYPAALSEIDAALAAVRHLPWRAVDRTNFPLPTLAEKLAEVGEELENGCGMVKLRRIPVDRYDLEDLRRLYV